MILKKKYLYRPVIEFKPSHGRAIRFSAGVASRPAPYQIGDKVDVLYDPNSPQEARINRFTDLWFAVILFIFFGLFLTGMGLIGFMLSA